MVPFAKIILASLLLLVIIPAFAEKPENTLDVIVIPENASVAKGKTVNMLIVVTNYNPNPAEITTLYIDEVSITPTKIPDHVLVTNSSLSIRYTLTADYDPGTRAIPITVQDKDGNIGIDILNLTISDSPAAITSAGLALDKIALLLLVYLIPAQTIERLLVVLNKRHNADHSHKNEIFLQDEKISSLGKLRDKVVENAAKGLSKKIAEPLVSKIRIEIARGYLRKITLDKITRPQREVNRIIKELGNRKQELAAIDKEDLSDDEIKELEEISETLQLKNRKDLENALTNKEIDELLKDSADIDVIAKFLEDKEIDVDIKELKKMFDNIDTKLKSSTKECLEQIKSSENYTEMADAIMNGPKFGVVYDAHIGPLDKASANAQHEKSKHQSEHEWEVWVIACIVALIPAVVLSYFEMGVLQVLGVSGELWVKVMDAGISALFIGSGTKPIHDIIDYIQKVRASK